ncbi:hypothetical protein DFJ74DRAFT_50468 [Hyaloraphidium curvatum]|nr:hypothetical protein DFJ74DRAFT_50468 [Hyaloraphidium curvatum]
MTSRAHRPALKLATSRYAWSGSTSGVQAVGATVEAALARDPTRAGIALDSTNAHNNFPRAVAFEEVREHMPGMAPWARTLLSRPSKVTFADPSGLRREPLIIYSYAGAAQGAADAGPLFDLTNSRLLRPARDVPNVVALSISDNTTILGPPEAAFRAVELVEQSYGAHGMSISREQSEVFSPDPDPAAQQRLAALAAQHRLRYSPAGIIVVGIPIGTDEFVRQHDFGGPGQFDSEDGDDLE